MENDLYYQIGENRIFEFGSVLKYSQHCYIGQLFLDKIDYKPFVLDVMKKEKNIITANSILESKEYIIELTPKEDKKISNFKIASFINENEVLEIIERNKKRNKSRVVF